METDTQRRKTTLEEELEKARVREPVGSPRSSYRAAITFNNVRVDPERYAVYAQNFFGGDESEVSKAVERYDAVAGATRRFEAVMDQMHSSPKQPDPPEDPGMFLFFPSSIGVGLGLLGGVLTAATTEANPELLTHIEAFEPHVTQYILTGVSTITAAALGGIGGKKLLRNIGDHRYEVAVEQAKHDWKEKLKQVPSELYLADQTFREHASHIIEDIKEYGTPKVQRRQTVLGPRLTPRQAQEIQEDLEQTDEVLKMIQSYDGVHIDDDFFNPTDMHEKVGFNVRKAFEEHIRTAYVQSTDTGLMDYTGFA